VRLFICGSYTNVSDHAVFPVAVNKIIFIAILCIFLFIDSTTAINIKDEEITEDYFENRIYTQKNNIESTKVTYTNNYDVLDQYQNGRNYGECNLDDLTMYGQSFRPSYDTLTRVNMSLSRHGMPNGNVILKIRGSLEGEDLASVSLTWESVTLGVRGVSFDFPDIKVEIGKEYFLVLICENQYDGSYMAWGQGAHQDYYGDPYTRGEGWLCTESESEGKWHKFYDAGKKSDWAFETYGTGNKNQPSNKPDIDGPITWLKSDKEYEYKLTADDPENGEVFYFIEWGDDSNSSWIGPYNSVEEITKNHSWDFEENENYVIKAKTKDIFDEESDWSTIEISKPKIKEINSLNARFLKMVTSFLKILTIF